MELKSAENQEIIIGGNKQMSFSIDDSNPVIFDILRNKMYSNKIGAICREVASNSRDANREAGVGDIPVEIEFTKPENLFSIGDVCIIFRDYGVGITPDRMENVFMKYAASTKRDSNSQTGGFGLGAKTPFAYTDSFIIKTICDVDGVRWSYVYNAIIDRTGKGKMIVLDEVMSDSPHTGTEIIVPIINQQDRNTFEKECYYATSFWSNIKYINFEQSKPKHEVVFKSDNFTVVKRVGFSSNYIGLIDGIPYSISPTTASRGLGENYTILLDLEVGQVSINANRESIQHDTETVEYLNEKVEEVKSYFSDLIESHLTTHASYKEAVKKFVRLKSRMFKSITDDAALDELIYSLKNNYNFSNSPSTYVYTDPHFRVFFDGEEVHDRIKLKAHIAKFMEIVDVDFEGDKLTSAKASYKETNDVILIAEAEVYLMDKGRPSVVKNYHIDNNRNGKKAIILYPIKDASEEDVKADLVTFELMDINPKKYSEVVVKVERQTQKKVADDFVKLHIRRDNYTSYSTEIFFNKVDKKLYSSKSGTPYTEKFVFIPVGSISSFSNLWGRESDEAEVVKMLNPNIVIYYITESRYRCYLADNGFTTLNQEYNKVDKQILHKYLEFKAYNSIFDNINPILTENFSHILPKSFSMVQKQREDLLALMPNLENTNIPFINWSRLGITHESKINYSGIVEKFEKKMEMEYPMLLPYLSTVRYQLTDNKKRRVIDEINKYLKNK